MLSWSGGSPMSKEQCPMCPCVTFFRKDPAVMENLSTRISIAKARSGTDLSRNFADKIKVIPLLDKVHGHGNIDNIL